MIPSLRKLFPFARSTWKAGAIAFGVFLTLGLLAGVVLGNVAARQARRRSVEGAALRANETVRQTGRILEERSRALRLLATTPAARLRIANGPISRFKGLYPEFASVSIVPSEPVRVRRASIWLSAALPGGGRVVGVLKRAWLARLLAPERGQTEPTIAESTVLTLSGGQISLGTVHPPTLRELAGMRRNGTAIRRWSDGRLYLTLLQRLRVSDALPMRLAVVKGLPMSVLAAREAKIRQRALAFGLLLGAAPGALACFGIARSTRRLRAVNERLERRVTERTTELESAERSFRSIFENVPLGLYQCDAKGQLLRVNPSFAHMLGFPDPGTALEELTSLHRLGEPSSRAQFMADLMAYGHSTATVVAQTRCGEPVWLQETARAVYGPDGSLQGFEGAVSDVSEQRALEDQLRRIGATDPLTGLLNRRGLQEAIGAATFPATAIVLDVDRFKEFNDTHGHPAGDQALRTVADLMQRTLPPGGLLARTGGEEFVVFLPGAGLEDGLLVADKIRLAVEGCHDMESGLTVSGGVARADEAADVTEAFEEADRALYSAKEGGRNRIVASGTSLL